MTTPVLLTDVPVVPGTDPVTDCALMMVERGVDSVDGFSGLMPLVYVQDESGAGSWLRPVAGTMAASTERAFSLLDTLDFTVGAVTYSGMVEFEGQRWDAVLVEARGPEDRVVRIAQRYEVQGRLLRRIRLVGSATLVRQGD